MPCPVVPEFRRAVIPKLNAERTALLEADTLENAVHDRAEYPAISHVVNVQNLKRIAHRRVFVKGVPAFKNLVEMIKPGFVAAQILPNCDSKIVAGFGFPFV